MMTSSGTEYSHEFFFYTQNVSKFWVRWFIIIFYYYGCYYWGLKLTGTTVPLCSASNKMRKTDRLSTSSFVKFFVILFSALNFYVAFVFRACFSIFPFFAA